MTKMTGLLRKRGLIDWKSLHCLSNHARQSVQEAYLSFDCVPTLLTQVHEVHDSTSQVSKSGDRLHLNGVHLLERVVQDPWSVDDLPSEVLVVHMTDKEGFGGESVRLNIDIRPGNLVDERTLSDVWVTTDQEGTGVGIDRGQTRNVLSDLLEVGEGVLLSLHDGSHTTESGLFQLLTSVQRVTELEQSDIVLGDLGDEVSGSVELTQSKLVVVLVVKNVQQGGKERVQVLPLVAYLVQAVLQLTSRMGNSEMIRPIFSSKVSWVNLTFRM